MFQRLFEIPYFQKEKYPLEIALANYEMGEWKYFSTLEFCDYIDKAGVFLKSRHIAKGDAIALVGKAGNPYWNMLDLAALKSGVIVVPILSGVSVFQAEYILSECNIKHLFFASKEDEMQFSGLNTRSYSSYCLNSTFFDDIPAPDRNTLDEIERVANSVLATDLATIIYTSGTTGEPKGVMLSHQNILSNILSIMPLIPSLQSKVVLSFLPLSHIFERTVTFTHMAMGSSIYYAGSIEKLEECFISARPQYFSAVPRLVEKMVDKVMERRAKAGYIARKLIDWAMEAGENFEGEYKENVWQYIKRFLADITVYRAWRKALGGRVEGVVVGAAALQPKLSRLFSAAGIPIREGYGCTETSPVIAFNHFHPGGYLYGSVGMPLPGVEVKIEEDSEIKGEGEILVKGPNVMMGYYKKPDLTAEVMTTDGWYRTGDIGHFTNKWFLKITDRKRDIFKISQGTYVAPQVIENHLKTAVLIDQCMVWGLGKPYLGALIVPNFNLLREWCNQNKIHWTAPQYMVINPKVQQQFTKIIDDLNQSLSKHEKVERFCLLHEEWKIENGELTPTMKVRRKIVYEKYKKQLEELF
ncbi:MAG: AMP-dependent synthetase/ligase [Saprospiraceae bacterium]